MSETIRTLYSMGAAIGHGKYATVKRAIHKQTGQEVAVKCISLTNQSNKEQEQTEREIRILVNIDHPNCVQLLGVYSSSKHIYLVMELMTGGELFARIVEKNHYSETEAASVFVQIMRAVEYLHAKGVVHRDIKPENVLYATREADSPVKLVDFGLGLLLDNKPEAALMHTICGTPAYAAPEIMSKRQSPEDFVCYGKGCDIWSAGVLLYCLLSGQHPFDIHAGILGLTHQITAGLYSFSSPIWSQISQEAKLLVVGMMTVDPKERLTASECLAHPWCVKFMHGQSSITSLSMTQMLLKERADSAARRQLLGCTPPSVDCASRAAQASRLSAPHNQVPFAGLGCLLAKGEKLEIVFINTHGKALLACPSDPNPAPRYVSDLLDECFNATHSIYMAKVMQERRVPKGLQHPLRNVRMTKRDGTSFQANLCVGLLDADSGDGAFKGEGLFYAYFVPLGEEHCGDRPAPSVHTAMEAIYGGRVTHAVLRGSACPVPEVFAEATVCSCTVVADGEFPEGDAAVFQHNAGSGRGQDWEAVKALAYSFHVRVVGWDVSDCGRREHLVCTAGMNHLSHDLSFDQVGRMVDFVAAVQRRLKGRLVRVGVAVGPVHMSWELRGASEGGVAGKGGPRCTYAGGEAVDAAVALERSGVHGRIRLSRRAVQLLCLESGLSAQCGAFEPDEAGMGDDPEGLWLDIDRYKVALSSAVDSDIKMSSSVAQQEKRWLSPAGLIAGGMLLLLSLQVAVGGWV